MLRNITVFYNSIIFIFLLNIFLLYNKSFFGIHLIINLVKENWFNIKYLFFFDSIALFFIILCIFLLILCVILCWYWSYRMSLYLSLITIMIFCLINLFLVTDILLLFIFFELVILPLFLLIGIWGSRDRKIYAAYLLFIYTLLGSILALLSFIILYFNKGSFNFIYFNNSLFIEKYQILVVILLFLGFSVKIPIVPIHIWLPEAHVEAPTVGSVILAGIMLKLGIYVYLRLILFTFSFIIVKLMSIFFFIGFIGLYISSFAALAQIDIKKVIAYSSIAHMNFSLIGLFCNNLVAILGAFFMMFGHAIVSGALFFCIGMLYDRYKTRVIFYYGGIVILMPIWVTLFFIFILGNFGLPGTVNFVGEFVIFIGSFFVNNFIIFCLLIGLFLTLIYSLFLYTKIAYGSLKIEFIRFFSDLSRRETYILLILFILVIFFGINANILFDFGFSSIFFWFFY